MSTVQGYEYQQSREARRRATLELERRRLERARLRAARAAAVHHQTMEYASRQEGVREAALASQARSLGAGGDRLARLDDRSRAARQELATLDNLLAASRAELVQAQEELRAEIARVTALETEAACEANRLQATLKQARQALDRTQTVARASVDTIGDLAGEAILSAQLETDQAELEQRIHQIEAEIAFATQKADLAPVAMATLMAMEENGYSLRETIGKRELISYFARQDAEHQLAVRIAVVSRPGEETGRWDLLAETFGLYDETCLHEIADFETAMEEIDLGTLLRTGKRIYPKDDYSPVRVPGGLPRPLSLSLRRRTRQVDSRIRSR